MVSGRGEILEEEKLESNLRIQNLMLDSCKDSLPTVIVWKAEYASVEAHGCINNSVKSLWKFSSGRLNFFSEVGCQPMSYE